MHPLVHTRLRISAYLCAGLCCAVVAGGCGSSGKPSRATAHASAFLAFAKCMRANGVPNFPDPSSGGGVNIGGSGINPLSPSFKLAQAKCRHELPGGGPPAMTASEQAEELAQMAKISECMRTHGVTGFPDPTTVPPSGSAQYSIAEGRGSPGGRGVYLLVPNTIAVDTPVFKAAAKACNFN